MSAKEKKTLNSFQVSGKLTLIVDVTVEAANLEGALVKAKELKELDFVEMKGQWLDGSLKILGISDKDWDL